MTFNVYWTNGIKEAPKFKGEKLALVKGDDGLFSKMKYILEIDSLEELSILQRENEYEIIVDFVNMSIEIYSDYRE